MAANTHYLVHLALGSDWGHLNRLIRGLKGRKGLSVAYDNYARVFTLTVWDETTNSVVRLLKDQVEDAGGVWKVAV